MKILWMTWKDLKNPLAGGAEVVNEELAKRLVADGHEVTFIVGGYRVEDTGEKVEGQFEPNSPLNPNPYTLIRLGNRYSVYWKAYRHYKKHLVGWPNLVIDEINTIPFFAKLYVKEPSILFVHMLCRKIWFYEMVFPLSLVGYLGEPVYIWLLRKQRVITVSDSTKQDLLRYGFKPDQVNIISEGIQIEPLKVKSQKSKVPSWPDKYSEPTILSLGAMRAMKRTIHQLKAFELAKSKVPDLKLKVAGDVSSKYGQKVLRMIQESPYVADIEYLGRITAEQKLELLQKCHVIMVTSVKEGWGLVVTEAASQGTPAVVYDVDGLRDSVRDGETGLVCPTNSPTGLADKIVQLFSDNAEYARMQKNAWDWSKDITFEHSYIDFKQALEVV